MNDKIQAMVKKVALISLGGVLQQDDLSLGAAGGGSYDPWGAPFKKWVMADFLA